ncbi:MAG TPA: hypothetical protein VK081_04185 [Planctomycetota bacterium]|nr:hypothetical protein [Planctomycetota bacterium]
MSRPSLLLAPLLAACASPSLPEGTGRGLLSHDRTPPEGVPGVQAPRWQPGDRFVFQRGNVQRLVFHVEPRDDRLLLVDEGSGERQVLATDLTDLGHEVLEDGEARTAVALAPGDVRYHWPLWVGKRWSCHFLRKVPGHPPLPLLVSYVVEAAEPVTTPAGRFETLRILRRATVAAEGTYLERASLVWYAPEAGIEVRRLEDGILTELVELHRQ